MWWPGITEEIETVVRNCQECCKAQSQRAQPLTPSSLPQLPWQKVASDLFEWKQKTFLIIVNYYSRYVEIARLSNATAEEVVNHTKSIFARHGIPEVVISDNGPQYTSETYAEFAKRYQFQHVTSSPYYPQSNGEVERAVKTVKNMLKKCEDPYLALLTYRSTPLEVGYSPSQLLMGRILRSTVPTTRDQRAPQIPDPDTVHAKDANAKAQQKVNYDSHHGVRLLPSLSPGVSVWMSDRQTEATVDREVGPQSFEVTTSDGIYRRNRRDLIVLPEPLNSGHDRTETCDRTDSNARPTPESNEPQRSNRAPRQPERLDPSWVRIGQ